MADAGVLVDALSTLIGAVALGGVAASLLIQARELRLSRAQAFRESQLELIRMSLENMPVALEFSAEFPSEEEFRKAVYCNWRMRHLELGYVTGEMSKASLETYLRMVARSQSARQWWSKAGPFWGVTAKRGRASQFVALANRAFDEVGQMEAAETSEVPRRQGNAV